MISVIIRNRNEGHFLKSVLKALSFQDAAHEVVLVDNGSRDDSLELAAHYGARVVTIDDFTYGRGLNVGFEAARGDVCVVLSAHSLPLGTSFLSTCAKAFADRRVGGARCVYVGKSADAERWLAPEMLGADGDFVSRGILASGCAVRRATWEETPFDENLAAAEDKIWTRDVLRKGWKIVSPVPAFYAYLKTIPPHVEVAKNYRELVAIREATDETVGFAGQPVSKVARRVVASPLAAAAASLRTEVRRLRLRLKFPK